ncbi:MAG: hypothetical protein AB7O38_21900 [Pirellulaceae bacterium]
MRSFLLGFVLGAATLYGSMCFHVVQAQDGYHVVAKTGLTVRDTYVDIRNFTLTDWREHVGLAEALMKANKSGLVGQTAENTVRQVFDDLLTRQPQ